MSTQRVRLGVDIDGVLSNFARDRVRAHEAGC